MTKEIVQMARPLYYSQILRNVSGEASWFYWQWSIQTNLGKAQNIISRWMNLQDALERILHCDEVETVKTRWLIDIWSFWYNIKLLPSLYSKQRWWDCTSIISEPLLTATVKFYNNIHKKGNKYENMNWPHTCWATILVLLLIANTLVSSQIYV